METGYIKIDPVNIITIWLMALVGFVIVGFIASMTRQYMPGTHSAS